MTQRLGLIVLLLCALAASPQAASTQCLRYLGEVGHLWPPFSSVRSISFGSIRVVSKAVGELQFSGRDDDQTPWTATVPVGSGVGFTDVWQADFDRNGRQDLLIAAYFPLNGRCVDQMTLLFLLFNDRGQPVPWVVQTRLPKSNQTHAMPAIFADLEHDGRMRLVATDCSYSTPPRFGEDRSITGIYVAENASWRLVRPANIAGYIALVRHRYRFQPGHDKLLSPDPIHWPDQGNTVDAHGPPTVKVKAVLPRSPDCQGIRLEVVANDPCDVAGKDRIELSNGTVCLGWPTTVIDGPNGREIVADPNRLRTALERIVHEQRPVVFAGQTDSKRCSPTTAWAMRH
ncbi:MAG: hypothetical protein M3O20_10640 [Acidobacteriota bacterium]|nr:hypothetical protein [Acidobacteriota bacterium]